MPTTSKTALLCGGALFGVLLSCYAMLKSVEANRELRGTQKKLKKEQELRKMERAGRTKAERRLRLELKALIKGQTDGGVNLKPVARMQSPFKGRCGTPRQGLLAPNAKYVSLYDLWFHCQGSRPLLSLARPLSYPQAKHSILPLEKSKASLPLFILLFLTHTLPSRHIPPNTFSGVESSSNREFAGRPWTS
jgi:hypothetical protein